MQRFTLYFFLFGIIIIFNTCETDFDVAAPYKETPIIYGLLNVDDSIQWIRINKAFGGEGNALVMAQVADSINYPDILDVKLEEYSEFGAPLRKLNLIRDSSIQKEPGIFATTPNILYRTSVNDQILEKNNYKLVVYNRESGKTATANAEVVNHISVSYPFPALLCINFGWSSNLNSSVTIKWSSVPEGKVYQLTIRYHYKEQSISNPQDIQDKYLDWVFAEDIAINPGQSQSFSQLIQFPDFYNFVASQLNPNSDVIRKSGAVECIFTVGANEYYTYVQVNKPPTGANQNIPQFTNVEGGLGIFSSRLKQSVTVPALCPESLTELQTGSITGDLGFQ